MIADLTPMPAPRRMTEKRIAHYAKQKAMRREQRDAGVSWCGLDKRARIDLGLALLRRRAIPGVGISRDDVAFWCGCTATRIGQIELRALRKLRGRLRHDPLLRELLAQYLALA